MKAIIVAGGRGDRLKPITDSIPKPMVTVNNKPILLHTINLLKKHGINEFIIALCYLPNVITDYFGDGSRFDVKIEYTYEDPLTPLGTAGAINLSKNKIYGDFIVTYADILRKLDVSTLIKKHQSQKSFATINVYERLLKNAGSIVQIDELNNVIEFIEHPTNNKNQKIIWSNGSFYVFSPKIFRYIPSDQSTDFAKDIFPKLIENKEKFLAYPTSDYFIDIGNIEKLEKARLEFND